jgi:hypothetical protein
MRYALLIYGSESARGQMTPEEMEQMMKDYTAFTDEVKSNGVYDGGDALQPVATASTVRVRSGETLTTDGPFAETKEQLGGFYILDCKDLDEAIEYAAKIPNAKDGSIEVRPIQEFPEG